MSRISRRDFLKASAALAASTELSPQQKARWQTILAAEQETEL